METGSITTTLIKHIDISSFLHKKSGSFHVTISQSMVKCSEGGIVGGTVDVSSSLWNWKQELEMFYLNTVEQLFLFVEQ